MPDLSDLRAALDRSCGSARSVQSSLGPVRTCSVRMPDLSDLRAALDRSCGSARSVQPSIGPGRIYFYSVRSPGSDLLWALDRWSRCGHGFATPRLYGWRSVLHCGRRVRLTPLHFDVA